MTATNYNSPFGRQGTRLMAVLALFMFTSTVQARQDDQRNPVAETDAGTHGFLMHARTGALGVGYKGDHDGSGASGGFRLGYALNEHWSLFVGLEGSSGVEGGGDFDGLPDNADYAFGFVDFGARYHFRPQHRWMPFAEAAFSVMGLSYDGDLRVDNKEVTYGGFGASLAGGVSYFVLPKLAIEGSTIFTPGAMLFKEIGSSDTDINLGTAGVRLSLGLSWYPFR